MFFFKGLGVFGALALFFWGIIEFETKSKREYEKDFFLEQIKVMNQVVNVVSTLASLPDSSREFKKAEIEIERLRVGTMYVFSDVTLDNLIGEFYSNFNSYQAGELTKAKLAPLSYNISVYCTRRIRELTKVEYD